MTPGRKSYITGLSKFHPHMIIAQPAGKVAMTRSVKASNWLWAIASSSKIVVGAPDFAAICHSARCDRGAAQRAARKGGLGAGCDQSALAQGRHIQRIAIQGGKAFDREMAIGCRECGQPVRAFVEVYDERHYPLPPDGNFG